MQSNYITSHQMQESMLRTLVSSKIFSHYLENPVVFFIGADFIHLTHTCIY